jgi:hypothetical protein
MSDILKRLDTLAPGDPPDDIEHTAIDAAAEIRRLRDHVKRQARAAQKVAESLADADAGL